VTKQIEDLAAKTKLVHESAQRRTGIAGATAARKGNGRDEQMSKLVKAAEKIANEEKSGLLAAVVKDRIFSATVDTDVSGATVPAGVDTQMSEANTS